MRYLGLSVILGLSAVAGTGCDAVRDRNPDGTYTSSRSTYRGTDRGSSSTARTSSTRRATPSTARSSPTTR